MLLTFHSNFEQVFVAYVSTHLFTYLLLMYQLICFFAHIHKLATEEKNTIVTKHITAQDQTYSFNYLISKKC